MRRSEIRNINIQSYKTEKRELFERILFLVAPQRGTNLETTVSVSQLVSV